MGRTRAITCLVSVTTRSLARGDEFARLDARLMSVDFRAVAGQQEVGLPVELFEIAGFSGPTFDDYAPSADGQRFLVRLPVSEARSRPCTS